MSVSGGSTCPDKVDEEGQECSITVPDGLIKIVFATMSIAFITMLSMTVFYGATGLNTLMNVCLVQMMILANLLGQLDET